MNVHLWDNEEFEKHENEDTMYVVILVPSIISAEAYVTEYRSWSRKSMTIRWMQYLLSKFSKSPIKHDVMGNIEDLVFVSEVRTGYI